MKGCSTQEIHAINFKKIADSWHYFQGLYVHLLNTVIHINHDIIMKIWRES